MDKEVDSFVGELLADLTPRQRRVVSARFGLKGGKQATLQEIGTQLGVTRERVRQIQGQVLKRLGERIRKEAPEFASSAKKHLVSAGGVRQDEFFVGDVAYLVGAKQGDKSLDNKLRFLLTAIGEPLYQRETDEATAFWYADDQSRQTYVDFVSEAVKFFDKNKKGILAGRKNYPEKYGSFPSCHFLSISKHFGIDAFGRVGLVSWPETQPKTIRDKAYLVLKRFERPVHFEDIAKGISQLGIDKGSAHVQTVHNELIKDNRFVLVGRGIYALAEQGFEPGTVREVIARILDSNGPLPAPKLVKLVNEQRILKENTILLNLQNRRYFQRLGDGRYKVREV